MMDALGDVFECPWLLTSADWIGLDCLHLVFLLASQQLDLSWLED
jgi:hypothetical protein